MKRRMVYPDMLRAFSCIAVVFLSVSMAAGCTGLVGVLTWAAPMFVMLSGMFFLDSNWYISPREMIQRYGARLIASYVVWGAVALGVNQLTGGVIKGILSGSALYLNFLFVMIILYVISPFLRVFTRAAHERDLWYIVIVGIIIGCVYPYVQIYLETTRMIDYALMGFGYISIFIAGWYLRTAEISRRSLRMLYLLGSICLILSLRGIWMGLTAFSTDSSLMILSPDAVLIAIALFLVVKNTLAGRRRIPYTILRPFAMLARFSFGIYLIHPILLALVCYELNNMKIVLPIGIFVPLVSIVLLLVSGLLTMLIQKIPKIGRYLT